MRVVQVGNGLLQQLRAAALAAVPLGGHNGTVQIHVFKSERDPLAIAFTSDPAGFNLPADLAPWRSYWGAILPTGSGFSAYAATRAAVEEHGFCVRRTGYAA